MYMYIWVYGIQDNRQKYITTGQRTTNTIIYIYIYVESKTTEKQINKNKTTEKNVLENNTEKKWLNIYIYMGNKTREKENCIVYIYMDKEKWN